MRHRRRGWSTSPRIAVVALLGTIAATVGGVTGLRSPPPAPRDIVAEPAARAAVDVDPPLEQRAGQGPGSAAGACPYPDSGFDCDRQRRFAAAEAYLSSRPGTTAIVIRDRHTGAVWRNRHADELVWTASTIKLAMAVDLLLRDRGGAITLTAEDRALLRAMLRSSDDEAANTLWLRYDGAAALDRYRSYGLRHLTFPTVRKWGSAKCTAEDLDRLMRYVLEELPRALRDVIVADMRAVAPNQRWGVWGAGPAAVPGTKNGWWGYRSGWVINSVGFLGPGERYTLTLMNDLRHEGGYDDGRQTVTKVTALIYG